MKNWFKVSIRFDKINTNGKEVKTTESYLINSMSFTESEARIIEEMKKQISGEFEISSIQKKNYSEIINSDWSINQVDAEANKIMGINKNQSTEANKWFDCKINFIGYDEQKGIEKKTSTIILVHANSVNSAHDTLIESLRGMVYDYEIEKVADSKIIDVFKY